MSDAALSPEAALAPPAGGSHLKTMREVIYRHTFLVRLTHWINALAIFVMIGTGLNIFNAHANLYWGQAGNNSPGGKAAFLRIFAKPAPHGPGGGQGVLEIGPLHFNTTGFLGWSKVGDHFVPRAWPAWLTIPSPVDLADARHWHFFFAWILVMNGLLYLVWSLIIRHLQRDLVPTVGDLRAIPKSIWDHMRLKHPVGEEAKRYNVLQRLAYLGLILLVIGMVTTGLTMSPGFNAFAPWLLVLEGGRQSARSLHFICAALIVLFILVHVTEVFIAGPLNEIGSMITGKYRVPQAHEQTAHGEASDKAAA